MSSSAEDKAVDARTRAAFKRMFQTQDGRILREVLLQWLQSPTWGRGVTDDQMKILEGGRIKCRSILTMGDALGEPTPEPEDV